MSRHCLFTLVLSVALLPACVAGNADRERADALRNALPRYGGEDEFESDNTDYWVGIAVYAAIPLVLAALSLLVGFFFCLCRCCACLGCCKCCVYPPKPEGYTFKSRFIPWIFLVVFVCVTFAFGTVGQTANSDLTDTLASKDEDSGSFRVLVPGLVDDTVAKLRQLQAPLQFIAGSIGPTIENLGGILNGTADVVEAGTVEFIAELNSTGLHLDGLQVDSESGRTYPCDYCSTVSAQVQSITDEVDAQTGQSIAEFRSSLREVDDTLVQVEDDIVSQVTDVNGTINDNLETAEDAKSTSEDIIDALEDGDKVRNLVTLIFFMMPIACIAIVALGTLCRKACFFTVNVWVMWAGMFFMWVLLSIHLPLSLVLADVCVVVEDEEAKLTNNTDDMSKIMSTCLYGGTIVAALDLEDDLDFASQIEFPQDYNLTQQFDFSSLNQFNTEVQNLTLQTFGFNDSFIQGPLDEMNAQLGTHFTRFNISDLDPSDYSGGDRQVAEQGKNLTIAGLQDERALNSTLVEIQRNVSQLIDVKDALRDRLIVAQANITDIETLADPYIEQANILINASTCLFLGKAYRKIKDNVCEEVMGAISIMALSLFIIALLGTPIIITSQVSASRMPHPRVSPEELAIMEEEKEIGNWADPHPAEGQATPYGGGEYQQYTTAPSRSNKVYPA